MVNNLGCQVSPNHWNRVSGATIDIIAGQGDVNQPKNIIFVKGVTTDSNGFAETTFNLRPSSDTYTIKGNYFGDSQYEPATITEEGICLKCMKP
ncbi:MAG: hypothetical protein WA364_27250 [Candidatus Nitrosopolaris sp.]